MTTTIAVKEDTMELLRYAKEDAQAETYDELIQKLVLHSKRPQKSLFGKYPTMATFKRDKNDRVARYLRVD